MGKWRRFTIGKYKVLDKLGVGGMGIVYLCEHALMGRRVIIKVLPSARARDADYLQRFYREARAVAALDHPNIVRAYDVAQDGPLHFIVMEYVEGADLSRVVQESGPLPVAQACDYAWQAALGLQHAFERGVVHRDVKPHNLMLTPKGTGGQAVVKITDFGIARFRTEAALDGAITITATGDWHLTATGQFVGTPAYMAPEQYYHASHADTRADIFGLGCTLFYLLTRRSPFPGRTLKEKLAAWQLPPTPVCTLRPEVPAALADVLARALAREPSARQQTPAELAAALVPFASGREGPSPPPPVSKAPSSGQSQGGPGRLASTVDEVPTGPYIEEET
jgi:serine/threonine protein kinase